MPVGVWTLLVDTDPFVLGVVAVPILLVAAYQRFVRGFTTDDRIPLSAVRAVAFVEGATVTRPRFVVRYDRGGRERRPYVELPGLYTPDGEEAVERELDAFAAAGFDVRADGDRD